MTQTLEPDTASPARRRVETWLSDFAAALAARDADRAAKLMEEHVRRARQGLARGIQETGD